MNHYMFKMETNALGDIYYMMTAEEMCAIFVIGCQTSRRNTFPLSTTHHIVIHSFTEKASHIRSGQNALFVNDFIFAIALRLTSSTIVFPIPVITVSTVLFSSSGILYFTTSCITLSVVVIQISFGDLESSSTFVTVYN